MMESKKAPSKVLIYVCTLVAVSLWGLSYIWCDRLISLNIPV